MRPKVVGVPELPGQVAVDGIRHDRDEEHDQGHVEDGPPGGLPWS